MGEVFVSGDVLSLSLQDVLVTGEMGEDPRIQSYGWRLCKIDTQMEMGSNEEKFIQVLRKFPSLSTNLFIQMGITVMQVLFLYLVPLVVLSLFNVKLTRFLKMNANQMSKHGSSQR